MAINLLTEYPGRVITSSPDYTYGSSQNETIPDSTADGTPHEKRRSDDLIGFQQALLRAASIVPSENPDTQLVSEYMQAVIELAQGRAVQFDESGIVDAYVLESKANQQGPRSYFDGQEFNFTPGNVNSGASTIRFGSLPIVNLFNNGAALNGGELTPDSVKCLYNLADDRFDIQNITILTTQGVFTPEIFDVDLIDKGQTYGTQIGYWIKTGNKVDFNGRIQTITLGTLSGLLRLGSLPFISKNDAPGIEQTPFTAFANGFSTTVQSSLTGVIGTGQDSATLHIWDANDGPTLLTVSEINAVFDLRFSGTYFTA